MLFILISSFSVLINYKMKLKCFCCLFFMWSWHSVVVTYSDYWEEPYIWEVKCMQIIILMVLFCFAKRNSSLFQIVSINDLDVLLQWPPVPFFQNFLLSPSSYWQYSYIRILEVLACFWLSIDAWESRGDASFQSFHVHIIAGLLV